MEELKALQRQLIDMQKSSNTFKLSERTVVDIIQKISNRKNIKLIYTLNGKEYATEEKIMKEIYDEIKRNKGAASKLELSKNLDVSQNLIDKLVDQILQKDKSLSIIEGRIISKYFLENIIEEINYLLKTNGSLLISEVSNKFEFSINFFKDFLKENTQNGKIEAKYYANRLITNDYIQAQRQKIKPALLASTFPINVSTLVEQYGIDEHIIEEIINELIFTNQVKGKFASNIFEPQIYKECQLNYVKGSLMRNGYLEYEKLRAVGIKNGKDFLNSLKKEDEFINDSLFLNDYLISSTLKIQLESSIYENISKNQITNLINMIEIELSDEDIVRILEDVNIKTNSLIVMNSNVIPKSLIEGFIEFLKPYLKEEASREYNNYINVLKERERNKKNEEVNNTKKKGKSGKQQQKGKKNDEENNEYQIEFKKEFILLIQDQFFKYIINEDVNQKEETLIKIYLKQVEPSILKIYELFINEFISTKSNKTTDPNTLLNQIDSHYQQIKLQHKSLEQLTQLSKDQKFQQALNGIIANILKKDLPMFAKNILTYQLIHWKYKIDLNKLDNPNERKEIINSFEDLDIKMVFSDLFDSLQNKNFNAFMNVLNKNIKILAVSFTTIDKKREKSLIESYGVALSQEIDNNLDILGKGNKKDYIKLIIDILLHLLLKQGYYVKLPYEGWVISLISSLTSEPKLNLIDINEVLIYIAKIMESDEDFNNREEELSDLIKKLMNY